MMPQAKNFILIFFTIAMLVMVLLQSACKEETKDEEDLSYISREDFINTIKGEWYVNYCSVSTNDLSIYFTEDSVKYGSTYIEETITYSVDDTILCSLAEIGNIQYWTISENNDDLILETQDLCGVSKSYVIDYKNYHYLCTYWLDGGIAATPDIQADINLVSPDTTLTLVGFWYADYFPSLKFRLLDGDYQKGFRLYRKDQ